MSKEIPELESLDKDREKEASSEVEIDPEVERRLKIIAQRVGGDFGMEVEVIPVGKRLPGEPESGSYFNSEETKIVFDPEHVKRDPQEAEFVAGHEGGHRAITRGPESIGLKKEKVKEIYRQLGFAFVSNALEDPADNNWIKEKFPGLEPNIKKTYDRMLEPSEKENTPLGLSHPEALQSTKLLGYIPKFVHYGSEIIRYWHKGEFSKNVDPGVKKVLDKTKKEAEKYFKTIPGSVSTEKEVIEKAKERFLVNYEKIWPEVKKLVNEDLNDEKLRQMLKQALEQQGKGESKEEGEGESEENPLDKLPKNLQKELQNKAGQAKKELKKSAAEGEEDEKEMESATPIPMDELSDELKKKLKEVFDSLPEEQKKDLKEKAEQQLKELEDKLNEELKGKLNQDNPESHEKRVAEVKTEKKEKEKREREKGEVERARKEFEKKLEAGMSEYDKVYKEVKPLIDDLYRQLLKIFIPEKHPRWKAGYPSGSKLDLSKAMQYEADRSKYTELWQRKSIPRKIDYRFSLLVDLSGSMQGENIEHTFKGLVLVAEVLERLGIKYEILGFQDTIIPYKSFQEELNKETRNRISVAKKEPYNNGTHNRADYNSDGYCLDQAHERLLENKGKNNFLISMSDGLPVPDSAHSGPEYDLNSVIKKIIKEKQIKLIGLGLGLGTGHVEDYYPNSIANIPVKELPLKLARLFEEIIRHPGKY